MEFKVLSVLKVNEELMELTGATELMELTGATELMELTGATALMEPMVAME